MLLQASVNHSNSEHTIDITSNSENSSAFLKSDSSSSGVIGSDSQLLKMALFSCTDPQASAKPMIPLKQDELNDALAANSECMPCRDLGLRSELCGKRDRAESASVGLWHGICEGS
nr:sister chromatid cohesion 1 protein 4-like [Ipomoea trifida]